MSNMSSLSPEDSSESDMGPLDVREDLEWDDVEADQEELQFISLFDNARFSDVHAMIQYCEEKHGFDFIAIQRYLGPYVFRCRAGPQNQTNIT